jgi:O-antigen/teichoic acid export membrane protein
MAANLSARPPTTNDTGGLQEVIRGFGALAAGSLISQLIGFAALVYVARRTGATNLGAYTFALLLATYFNLFASLGIDYLAMRDVAQARDSVGSIVGETLVLQGVLSVILYIGLVAFAPLLATNHEVARMIPIVGLILFTTTFTVDWALLALGRSRSVALWRLFGQVVYAALVPLLVIGGRSGIFHYAWLNMLGLAVTGIGLMWAFLRVTTTRLHVSGAQALVLRLHRSMPFAYSMVMIQIYAGIGTLMLGYLDSTHAVGIYAVANKLPWALIGFANLWLSALFPHTAQRLLADTRGVAHDVGRIVTATIVIGAAATVGAFLCAGTLMATLFGASFHAAAVPFALLSGWAALVLVQANFSIVLLAGGSQRYYAVVLTIAAAFVVLFDLILIPPLGTIGAAIATVSGEIGLTTLTLMGVRRRLGPLPLDAGRLLRGAGAVGLMALAMIGARSLGGPVVQIGVALAAFVAAAWLFRVFDRDLIHR